MGTAARNRREPVLRLGTATGSCANPSGFQHVENRQQEFSPPTKRKGKFKVVCNACGASYLVRKDRVAGRRFRATCRRCRGIIIARCESAFTVLPGLASEPTGDAPKGEEQWYLCQDGRSDGPFNTHEVKDRLAAGQLDARVLVWQAGLSGWQRLCDVDAFDRWANATRDCNTGHRSPQGASQRGRRTQQEAPRVPAQRASVEQVATGLHPARRAGLPPLPESSYSAREGQTGLWAAQPAQTNVSSVEAPELETFYREPRPDSLQEFIRQEAQPYEPPAKQSTSWIPNQVPLPQPVASVEIHPASRPRYPWPLVVGLLLGIASLVAVAVALVISRPSARQPADAVAAASQAPLQITVSEVAPAEALPATERHASVAADESTTSDSEVEERDANSTAATEARRKTRNAKRTTRRGDRSRLAPRRAPRAKSKAVRRVPMAELQDKVARSPARAEPEREPNEDKRADVDTLIEDAVRQSPRRAKGRSGRIDPDAILAAGTQGVEATPRTRKRLSKNDIRRVMRKLRSRVEACFERHQATGRLLVRMTVYADGSAAGRVTGSLANSSTARCVAPSLSQLRFPSFTGSALSFVYPFDLR